MSSPFLLFLLLLLLPSPSLTSDTESLTLFRLRADLHGILAGNWSSPSACSGRWRGVTCSGDGNVTSLLLPQLDLRGPLDLLSPLSHLRILDLHNNRLNGSLLPLLPSLPNLKFLYLSNNDLSGEIPPSIGRLTRLLRIDISDNDFDGPIPGPAIANLTRLLTLRLDNNLFSGPLPDLVAILPNLLQLNVSNNQLSGRVPDGVLAKFGLSAVEGNVGLCGPRGHLLPPCSFIPTISAVPDGRKRDRMRIIAIAMANLAFFSLIVCFVVLACCCCNDGKVDTVEGEVCKGSSEDGSGMEKQGKMVFFEKGKKKKKRRFELEELLRASAEMLGKGSIGTVYRAGLEDGEMVVVKRLRDANPCNFKDFNEYMNLIGRLDHPNVVPLRAYYYAKQEKLLIYDYLPNGTLFSVLHGTYFCNSWLKGNLLLH